MQNQVHTKVSVVIPAVRSSVVVRIQAKAIFIPRTLRIVCGLKFIDALNVSIQSHLHFQPWRIRTLTGRVVPYSHGTWSPDVFLSDIRLRQMHSAALVSNGKHRS